MKKAYISLTDISIWSSKQLDDFIENTMKLDGKKMSKQEFNKEMNKYRASLDTKDRIICKKGDVFFRSCHWKRDDIFCLYPANMELNIDYFPYLFQEFGDGDVREMKSLTISHWANYLWGNEFYINKKHRKKGSPSDYVLKLKEIKTDQISFEESHIAPLIEKQIAIRQKEIDSNTEEKNGWESVLNNIKKG